MSEAITIEHSWPVLVVDDDRVATSVLQKLLEVEGYQVSVASDGVQAWDLIQENDFSIVLTDRQMPNMDGLDLCQKIRAFEKSSYTYIILLTVMTSKTEVIEGLNAGADDYLSKPYDYVELIARLNSAQRVLKLEQSLKRANLEVNQLSLTDDLTSALNRRAYNKDVDNEFKRALRYQHPVSVVLCDIDGFKTLKQEHSDSTCDAVLVEFVRRIRSVIRYRVDEVYRFENAKFIILLPETSPESAVILAERIRYCVANVPFTINDTNSLDITASFGACGLTVEAIQNEPLTAKLLEGADLSLEKAQQEGRDIVRGITLNVDDV